MIVTFLRWWRGSAKGGAPGRRHTNAGKRYKKCIGIFQKMLDKLQREKDKMDAFIEESKQMIEEEKAAIMFFETQMSEINETANKLKGIVGPHSAPKNKPPAPPTK